MNDMEKPKKKRLTNEEREFMEEFIREYYKDIVRMTLKYVHSWDAVKDVAGEVIEKLCSYVDRLQTFNRAVTYTYIKRVVKTSSINFSKKEDRENSRLFRCEAEEMELFSPSELRFVEDAAICSLSSREISELLSGLPKDDYDLLMGKYFMQMEDKELAKMLGCKPDSVRMKLTRAREKARNILREGGRKSGSER